MKNTKFSITKEEAEELQKGTVILEGDVVPETVKEFDWEGFDKKRWDENPLFNIDERLPFLWIFVLFQECILLIYCVLAIVV